MRAEPKAPLDTRIIERRFTDREVVGALDALPVDLVIRALINPDDDGMPVVHRTFAQGQGHWREGDPRPRLWDPDPAVMQAVGRCAASAVRHTFPVRVPVVEAAHPRPCGWCGYPLDEMLRALDFDVVQSRYVVSERLTWWQFPNADHPHKGARYDRSGTADRYLSDDHAALWADPDRMARIARVQYPEEAAA